MAGIDSNKVYLPGPDQSKTTGAVSIAAVGTACPADARTALTSPWTSGGYVGEDGIALGLSYGITTVRDWSKNAVRQALESFDGTVTLPFLQIDEWAATNLVGEGNYTHTAATTTNGDQVMLKLGAHLPPARAYCFSMKDENRRVRIFLPDAQITAIDSVSFVPGTANVWPATLTCNADADGHSIYVIYDDGTVVSG